MLDEITEMSDAAVTELLAGKMSGLETPIDLVYLLAVQDTQHEVARGTAGGRGCLAGRGVTRLGQRCVRRDPPLVRGLYFTYHSGRICGSFAARSSKRASAG